MTRTFKALSALAAFGAALASFAGPASASTGWHTVPFVSTSQGPKAPACSQGSCAGQAFMPADGQVRVAISTVSGHHATAEQLAINLTCSTAPQVQNYGWGHESTYVAVRLPATYNLNIPARGLVEHQVVQLTHCNIDISTQVPDVIHHWKTATGSGSYGTPVNIRLVVSYRSA